VLQPERSAGYSIRCGDLDARADSMLLIGKTV
jgi:hypothetical protein